MKKLAQSMKWTPLAVVAMVLAIVAHGAHAAASKVFCSSLNASTASLGPVVVATMCTDVLENVLRGSSEFIDHYTEFDGGGWVRVADVSPNTDRSGPSIVPYDGLRWITNTSPENFSATVAADWLVTIEPQDPASPPSFPRTYDLLLVLTRDGPNQPNTDADSVGFLLEDFTFDLPGQSVGQFDARFLASGNQVRGMDVFARSLNGPPSGSVPEPGSLLLLCFAGIAAITVAVWNSAWRPLRRSIA